MVTSTLRYTFPGARDGERGGEREGDVSFRFNICSSTYSMMKAGVKVNKEGEGGWGGAMGVGKAGGRGRVGGSVG